MIKRQYTLYLENKPGVFAKVSKALSTDKVNIEGISVAESTDSAIFQIIVNNSAKAKKALDKAKITYTSQKVAVLELPHEPGVLAGLAAKLAKAKVNINYMYGTATDDQGVCCLVVSAENLKKVEEVAMK